MTLVQLNKSIVLVVFVHPAQRWKYHSSQIRKLFGAALYSYSAESSAALF